MGNKHVISDLYQMQSLSLNAKVRMTQRRIREWVDEYGEDGVYISFSGGKDSTVLLNIARKLYPNIRAVFVDTGLEYPEIRAFVKGFDNVDWIRPKLTFREVIGKYGYGNDAQEDMAIEECSELVKAILKFRRSDEKTAEMRDAVIDEIADVQIMLTQLGIIFNCVAEVEERIDFKINRQMGRIKEREAKRDVC